MAFNDCHKHTYHINIELCTYGGMMHSNYNWDLHNHPYCVLVFNDLLSLDANGVSR